MKTEKEEKFDKVVKLMNEIGLSGIVIAEDIENMQFGVRRVNFSTLGSIGAAEFLKKICLNELSKKVK